MFVHRVANTYLCVCTYAAGTGRGEVEVRIVVFTLIYLKYK